MTRFASAIAAVVLALAALICTGAFAGAAATPERARTAGHQHGGWPGYGFEHFLRRYEAANTAFVNGDPEPWLEITAEKDPASIFGGFGGLGEAGVASVRERYRLAARAFRPSGAVVDFEYLVKDVRGRLAYTVARERAEGGVLYPGQTERQEHFLRVTMIFRFERGAWKIVHRQADRMVELELPAPPGPPAGAPQ